MLTAPPRALQALLLQAAPDRPLSRLPQVLRVLPRALLHALMLTAPPQALLLQQLLLLMATHHQPLPR